jgi:hypothetical protein
MATVTSVTKHFTTPKEGFVTTLSGSIGSGAATVPLNSTSGYTNGDQVAFVVDPGDAAKKQVFHGEVSGLNIINVVWTEGANVAHSAGATVVDYVTATHWAALVKGLLVNHGQEGGHKSLTDANGNEWLERGQTASAVNQIKISNAATGNPPSVEAAGDNANVDLKFVPKGTGNSFFAKRFDGWTTLDETFSVASGYNKGSKQFDLTTSADISDRLSAGMKLALTRGTTPPTQCTDLERDSSQYASRAAGSVSGVTFTDDFTVEAWVKLESYASGSQGIVSRYDGSTGFILRALDVTGQLRIGGYTSAGGHREWDSRRALPLGRWVHIAATLDMSANTATMYIDGESVDCANASGTAVALTQAGPLQVGAQNSGAFFDGKIADARIWSTIRTATQIRDNMNQQLVGNEAGLVSYFKLNGDFNDSTANANHLTGQAGAVATNADNPMQATEYAIIHKVSGTTVTVFTGTDHNIPNMTLTSPKYSVFKSPKGFNSAKTKWMFEAIWKGSFTDTGTASGVWSNPPGHRADLPLGEWEAMYKVNASFGRSGGGTASEIGITLSTANNSESNSLFTWAERFDISGAGAVTFISTRQIPLTPLSLSAQTTHYLNQYIGADTGQDTVFQSGAIGSAGAPTVIRLYDAYV